MPMLRDECWAITDAAAGNQRQALALAERLGLPVRHLVLEPRAPWSWFAPHFDLGGALALQPAQRRLFAAPWPRVAVGCGRAAALFTRQLRRLSAGHTYTVQILAPRADPAHWDCVIAPRHDQLIAPNVLNPLGSLNPIDDDWLADGRDAFPRLGELPQPRIGVLLGGPRQGIAFDASHAQAWAERLLLLQRSTGGSLLVLASRRTPPAFAAALSSALGAVPARFWASAADGPNPYPGVLGWADRLVVSPDSVNMLSEACAVGCPVQTLPSAPLPAKIERFHRVLRESGRLHPLALDVAATAPPPLRETASLAASVRQRIAARRSDPASA